ncbi:MAG: succinylglutamate desuccinylase/aspartoacylase family protein [Trueperaceae bacterium]|nr:MAG: succinylglutamate desuccinylase/aspartoacylase family protein [Trueperaceae bacterium]
MTAKPVAREPLRIAEREILPGSRVRFEIDIGRRATGTQVAIPVEVIHGRRPGPCLFVCAAIHGDEINGVEIVRRLLMRPGMANLRGTLIAVPIVNVFGFVGLSRYLPDRRDLNRSFPGTKAGSLASRLAHSFLLEIAENSTHGIDLHTGTAHRSNLPQVRASLDNPETERLARAFRAPVIIDADIRDGSLRHALVERNIPIVVYEAGEALRFDEQSIRAGVRGVVSVMRELNMIAPTTRAVAVPEPIVARSTHWVRAEEGGILRTRARLGTSVAYGERLGVIADPLGTREIPVLASYAGVVIGRTELPLVHAGDALFHLATFEDLSRVTVSVEQFQRLEPIRDSEFRDRAD